MWQKLCYLCSNRIILVRMQRNFKRSLEVHNLKCWFVSLHVLCECACVPAQLHFLWPSIFLGFSLLHFHIWIVMVYEPEWYFLYLCVCARNFFWTCVILTVRKLNEAKKLGASAQYNAILCFVWLNSNSSFGTPLHGIEEDWWCQGVKEYWVTLLARPGAIQDTFHLWCYV